MDEHLLLRINRVEHEQLVKQAAQIRLATQINQRRHYPLPLAGLAPTIVTILTSALPWLRRG